MSSLLGSSLLIEIAFGSVQPDGTAVLDSGVTVTHPATGIYDIHLPVGLRQQANAFIVFATPRQFGIVAANHTIGYSYDQATGIIELNFVDIFGGEGPALADVGFDFLVLRPTYTDPVV